MKDIKKNYTFLRDVIESFPFSLETAAHCFPTNEVISIDGKSENIVILRNEEYVRDILSKFRANE